MQAGAAATYRTTQQGPPRWKVAVVTWLGICPTVYLLFLLTNDLPRSWTLLSRTVLLTLAVVVLMSWLVAPQLTKLFKPWLFARRVKRNPGPT